MNNISSLSALRVFVRVAETGSISGAGRSLGLSSTAASRRIQDLEAALKVSLVSRSTRHVGLTEAGMYFYRHVDKFLKDLDATCASVTEMHDGPSGVLRIGSRRSFGLHLVVPSLQSFRERYPQISIQLKFIESPDTAPRDEIDLVLRLGAPAEKTLAFCAPARPI
jgi:DNA-binding transcriptional LysR family regulator